MVPVTFRRGSENVLTESVDLLVGTNADSRGSGIWSLRDSLQGHSSPELGADDNLARFKTGVIWTTPLKMPVVQPYRTQTSRSIITTLAKINIADPCISDSVAGKKQVQAFPQISSTP